jgi:hypothetical protein
MATSISIVDTITQCVTDVVEMPTATLLQDRYFGSGEMDIFDSKKVLVDFDLGDRRSGAFFKHGYGSGDTTTYFSQVTEPPRIAQSDNIDTIGNDKDRLMFEALCKPQGNIRPTRADAFNALLRLKAARCGDRILRSIERLCVLCLKYNAISFQFDMSPTDSTQATVDIQYYDPQLVANPQLVEPTVAWGSNGATPYEDICKAIVEVKRHGGIGNEVLLSEDMWDVLRADMESKGLWNNQIHFTVAANEKGRDSLFPEQLEHAEIIGDLMFNGHKAKVITYSDGYEDANGAFQPFLGTGFACVFSPNMGKTLFGCVSKVNPRALTDYAVEAVASLSGKIIATRYVDVNNDDCQVRCESLPLPMPRKIWQHCYINCLKETL